MQTIIVLTDFSEASSHAAYYACVLAEQLKASAIVLYHSCHSSDTDDEDENLRHQAVDSLTGLAASLSTYASGNCDIRYRVGGLELRNINAIIEEENAGLIVMGATGEGGKQYGTGSTISMVSEASEAPVVIVPPEVEIHPVRELIFACDMRDTGETVPRTLMHELINGFRLPLTVLHAGGEDPAQKESLKKWLDQHHPDYQTVEGDDIAKSILDFANQKADPLLIVIAKRHGFVTGLFHKSVTKELSLRSVVPILLIRQVPLTPEMPLLEI